jgi:hypothetical protein
MPTKRPDAEHLGPLTTRQVLGLAAMLKHGVVTKAAEEIGITERQLRRWAAQPAFQRALRVERRHLMDGAASRLASGAGEALDALLEVIRDKQAAPTARVSAARVFLETAQAAVSGADQGARLERLEQLVEGRAPHAELEDGESVQGAEQLQ